MTASENLARPLGVDLRRSLIGHNRSVVGSVKIRRKRSFAVDIPAARAAWPSRWEIRPYGQKAVVGMNPI